MINPEELDNRFAFHPAQRRRSAVSDYQIGDVIEVRRRYTVEMATSGQLVIVDPFGWSYLDSVAVDTAHKVKLISRKPPEQPTEPTMPGTLIRVDYPDDSDEMFWRTSHHDGPWIERAEGHVAGHFTWDEIVQPGDTLTVLYAPEVES